MANKVTLQVHHVRFFEHQPLAINCIAYDSSSNKAAVSRSDGSVQILSTADNWIQELSFPGGDDSSVEALVWCQQRLFAAGLGGNVVELDLDTQLTKEFVSSNAGPVWCLTKNQDETRLAAGTEDGCVVLFSVEEELQFLRLFGKQEGRILSIAWYCSPEGENIIITGAANNIRQWSVNSGQPISRMMLGRSNNKDTIVWCVTVTQDFTIISGDSRGVVTFWNGRLSTQMKTFQCHKADVLCLCLSEDEQTAFSGGVDASVHQFSCFAPDPNSDRKRWINQLLHAYHTHDVRALAYTGQSVASGGVDCMLQVASLQEVKRVFTYSPFPAGVLVDVDKEHNLVLLQYRKYLELWRLGSADAPEAKVQGILPLTQNPMKLIQLKAREGQEVISSALSQSGMIAFCDLRHVRLYRFDQDKVDSPLPNLSLERVKHTFTHPAKLMTFTPSGCHLVAVLLGAGVEVMDTKTGIVRHRLKTDSPVHILVSSPDCQHIAYATVRCRVYIADVTTGQVLCQCPVVSSQVSTLSFSPHCSSLLIAYCNQRIYEMDIVQKEYTAWSRRYSQEMARHWIQGFKTIRRILFSPDNPNQIFLHTDSCLVALDRESEEEYRRAGKGMVLPNRKSFKYKFLLHADFLKDGSLVVVERPPSAIEDLLPPSLKQKKFGIA